MSVEGHGASGALRRLGGLVEVLHAVVYFAPETADAYAALGLRGYWRGYFASRVAALGTPSAELTTAVCGGFAPRFVARAVPEVWSIASPEDVFTARRHVATTTLQRILAGHDVTQAAVAAGRAAASLDLAGRPLAAAHAALPVPADPVAALWHHCTVLREHRGDGHLAAVTAAGLSWPVPHLLAAGRLDPQQREYRGWTEAEWDAAAAVAATLLSDQAEQLEAATDRAAGFGGTDDDVLGLVRVLQPLAAAVVAADALPFPNAMGLPRHLVTT